MHNIKTWFEELTIVGRLRLIGGVAVMGMLIAGLAHNHTLNAIEDVVEQYTTSSTNMEKLDILTVTMLAEKENALNFLRLPDKDAKHRWQELSQENDTQLEVLVQVLPTKEMASSLEGITDAMQRFDKLFLAAVPDKEALGFHEDKGLVGKFRKHIHAVEAKLKRLQHTVLMASMLQIRRHEKDFMMRLNVMYVQQLHDEVHRFKQLLKQNHISKQDSAFLLQHIKTYQETFDEYQARVLRLTRAEKELSHIYTQSMVPALDQVHVLLASHIHALETKHETLLKSQTFIFWGILIFAMLAVLGLMSWIGVTITTPLNKITEAMDVLERGEIRHVSSPMKGAISELLDSLVKFQKQSVESNMLKQVVESSPQATMLADKDSLVISYMNPAALALFQGIESGLPCAASELVGKNIDIFHKDPSHQRKVLKNEHAFPMAASFEIGGRNIEFSAYTIKNTDGEWVSIMVSWNDVTEQAKLAQDFETNIGSTVDELIAAATQMQSSSEALSAMAEQSLGQATSVSSGAEEANHNVSNVASATEELTSSISEITQQVQGAVDISSQAVSEAEATNKTVAKLSEASQEIGEVVGVITDIAEQTNLLALNASIEAARAGDAGRGFAVVAGEVKELANQTAKATEQISLQISAIQQESHGAATAIEKIGQTIQKMNSINEAIAMAADEQSRATQEISQSVHHASDATVRVTGAIVDVRQAAEDTGKSAREVKSVSGLIRQKGESLSGRVTDFLASLRNR